MTRFVFAGAAVLSLTLAACGGDDGNGSTAPEAAELDKSGTHNTFVLDSLDVPQNTTEANQLGLNIDFDENDTADNQLGKILATLAAAGGSSFDLKTSLAETINQGTIILLASMQATDLSNATGAGLWIYLGTDPSVEPCDDDNDVTCGNHLDGQTTFGIRDDSPEDALITGSIAGGSFSGGPGTVRLDLPLVGDSPLVLDLIGAQAEVTVSASGLQSGRLGGAITEEALQDDVLPALHEIILEFAAPDCTGEGESCCVADSTGELLYELFDEDSSCTITYEEFRTNSLISTLLSPDLDLLDASGAFNPNSDGVADSLSLGVGFTAVGADFVPPAPPTE